MGDSTTSVGWLSSWDHKGKNEDRLDRAIKLLGGAENADYRGEGNKVEGKKVVKLRFADEEEILEAEAAEPLSPKRFNSVGRRDRVGRKRPEAMAFEYLDIATLSAPASRTLVSPSSAEERKNMLQNMKGISAGFYQHPSRAPSTIDFSEWLKMAKEGDADIIRPLALKPRKVGGAKYKRTFLVSELIDWLVVSNIVHDREQGLIKATSALKCSALEVLSAEEVSVLEDSEELICRWADDDSKPRPQTARASPVTPKGSSIMGKSSLMKSMMRKEKKDMTLLIPATGEIGIIRARKMEEPMLEIFIGGGGTGGDDENEPIAAMEAHKLSQVHLSEKLYLIDREVERAREKKELLAQSQPHLPASQGSDSGSDIKSPDRGGVEVVAGFGREEEQWGWECAGEAEG